MQQCAELEVYLVSFDRRVKESPGLKRREGREWEWGREGGKKEKEKGKKRKQSKITNPIEEKIRCNPGNYNHICLFQNQLT